MIGAQGELEGSSESDSWRITHPGYDRHGGRLDRYQSTIDLVRHRPRRVDLQDHHLGAARFRIGDGIDQVIHFEFVDQSIDPHDVDRSLRGLGEGGNRRNGQNGHSEEQQTGKHEPP